MTEKSDKITASRKKGLRVLILFAIFALCVGAAWWLERHRGADLIEGKSIIAEMRREKLQAFWQQGETNRWFIIRRGGKDVGWYVRYRGDGLKGGFEGGEMRFELSPKGSLLMTSRWLLNSQATEGTYLSDVGILARRGKTLLKRPLYSARIHLDSGQLDVEQHIRGGKYSSQADEPAGYIPEGTMDLVMYLISQRKTQAKFRMILDSHPPSGKWTTFVPVDIRIAKDKPLSVGGSAVLVTIAGQERLCFFDRDGRVEKRTVGEIEEISASQDEILAAFPEAATMLQNFK